MGDDYTAFADNPREYLNKIYQLAPSHEAVGKLAGNVASSIKEERSAHISALYLQAAARHLPAAAASSTAAAAAAAASASAAAAGPSALGSGKDVEAEMRNTQQIYEIVEVCTFFIRTKRLTLF